MAKDYIKVPKIGTKGFVRFKKKIRECEVIGGICNVAENSVTVLIRAASTSGNSPYIIHADKYDYPIYATVEDCRNENNPLRVTQRKTALSVLGILMTGKKFSWSSDHPWSVIRYRWNGNRPAQKSFRLPNAFILSKAKNEFFGEPNYGDYKYATAYDCESSNIEVVSFKKTTTTTIVFSESDCV